MVKKASEQNARMHDLLGKKRSRETPFLEGQEVYLYSGQKLNCVEQQKEWMRATMDTQQDKKMWTYNPAYATANFEFSGAAPPGVKSHQSSCPNDTYARLEGDSRPIWRPNHPRDKEEFRKPARDLGHARPEELKEAFVENEWHVLPIGQERRKPVSTTVRFEPDKIPHHRKTTERPFDPARKQPLATDFGPRSGFESVHYHGRMPGENRYEEGEKHNVEKREAEASKILHHKSMKTFSQGATRKCVQDADRYEHILKDPPSLTLAGDVDAPHPVTIRTTEPWHEYGCPHKEWQARLRENDASPPLDVTTGAYLPRDPEVDMTHPKRASQSGKLGKAPWRHGGVPGGAMTLNRGATEYPCDVDFDVTRQPPKSQLCENQLWKNASRTDITTRDRKHMNYRRPADYGVRIPGINAQ